MARKPGIGVWLLFLTALLVLAADAPKAAKEVDDGLDVYFRDVELMAMAAQAQERYGEAEPGESEKLERAFDGAPPQIPHAVEDLLPIARDDNECLECHHPDNAEDEDVPLPESHFQRPVMGPGAPGEPQAWKVQAYQKGDDITGARFDCSMCHTPQARNVTTPRNLFEAQKPPEKPAD